MAEALSMRRKLESLMGRKGRGRRDRRRAILQNLPSMESLEPRIALAVDVWTGASMNGFNWSDNDNWEDGSAPQANDDLIFPANAQNLTSVYDSGLGVSAFNSIEIRGSGYNIGSTSAGSLALAGGLKTTYTSSSSNFNVDFSLGSGSSVNVGAGGTLSTFGAISGSGGLKVEGGGTFDLTGSLLNTYTGTTTVDSGSTLILGREGVNAIPGNLALIGGSTVRLTQSNQISDVAAVSLVDGSTLDLNNFDDAIGALSLTGATVATGTGTLTLGGDVTTSSHANTSVISGNLDLGGATRTFTVANNAQLDPDLSITANISGTGAGLIKAGSNSQLLLSGNNTYDGTTTINSGAIEIASDNALGSPLAGTIVASGTSVALLGGITVPEPFTVNGVGFGGLGSIFNGNGNNTISGPITLGTSTNLGSLSGTLTFSGAISDGASSFAITKVQAGTVAFTAANTYDGGTTISGGTLAISHGSALGTGSVSVSSGATFEMSNDINFSRNISFSGTGIGGLGAVRSVSGNNTYSGTLTTLATNSEISVVSGQLELSGNLTDNSNLYTTRKLGNGLLLISGNTTALGSFRVVAGEARVTGTMASTVTLAGGNISGTGTVKSVNQLSGSVGFVDPGTTRGTIGTLTTQTGYAVITGATSHFDIGGVVAGTGYDQIVNTTSGSVILAGSSLEVALVGGFTPAIGDVFKIIDKQNAGAVIGTFNGLAEGATFRNGIVTYQVSYAGGDGNDVTLTVVAVTYTWTGLGGDSNWSTAANWDTNQVPSDGMDVVFASGAARLANTNDLAGLSLYAVRFTGSGYFVTGNGITVTDGFSSTAPSGVNQLRLDTELAANITVDVATGGVLVLGGQLAGGGFGLTKTGGGTASLAGGSANTFSGATTVNGGILQLSKVFGPAIGGSLVVNAGASALFTNDNMIADSAAVTVNQGTLDLNGYLDTIGSLSLTGGSVKTGQGTLTLASGGSITSNASSTTSTLSGKLGFGGPNNFLNVAQGTTASGVDLEVSAVIDSMMNVIKSGAGTLLFSAANNYSGGTNINAGVLAITQATGAGIGVVNILGSGTLDLSGGITLDNPLNVSSGGTAIRSSSGSNTIGGSVSLSSDTTLDVGANSDLTISGEIGGGSSLIKGGQGTLTLSANNAFTGATTATSGILRALNSNAFGGYMSDATVAIQSGASLELANGVTIPSSKTITLDGLTAGEMSKIWSHSGTNTIAGNIDITGGNNQSIHVAPATTLFIEGSISGSRDLDKNGPGSLILTGTSTLTGTVNVGDGTLIVNGSLAEANAAFVDGTLGGLGRLPAVTISDIGTLAPGNSPNAMTTGNLTFSSSGSTYAVELNGPTAGSQYDQTIVRGDVSLANATLSVSLGYTPARGDTFRIIDNDGSDAVAGTFNGLAEGSTITMGPATLRISYVGGTGNDVTLEVVSITYTWDGGGANSLWSNAANWVGDVVPTAGADLIFPGGSSLSADNDLSVGTAFRSITIAAAGYSIGGNLILLEEGISATYAAGLATVGMNIRFIGDQDFRVAGGTLVLSGGLDDEDAGYQVTKSGDGMLRLSGGNAYAGHTTIAAGTLQVVGTSTLGTTASGTTIEDGATLSFNVAYLANIAEGITVGSAGGTATILQNGAPFTISGDINLKSELFLDVQGGTMMLAGVISDGEGVFGITKRYSDVILGGANTFDGDTHILSGTLIVTNRWGLGSTVGRTVVDDGATLAFETSDDNVIAENLTLGSGQGESATLRNVAGHNKFTGEVLLRSDAVLIVDSGIPEIGGVIFDGEGDFGLTKLGQSPLILSGSNTFGGLVAVNEGELIVRNPDALGGSASGTTVLPGASLVIETEGTFAEPLTLGGSGGAASLVHDGGDNTWTGGISLVGDAVVDMRGGSLKVVGGIDGVGKLIKTGDYTLILASSNTYSGGTDVLAGALNVEDSDALGTGVVRVGQGDVSARLDLVLPGGQLVSNDFEFNTKNVAGLVNRAGSTTLGGTVLLREYLNVEVADGTQLTLGGLIGDEGAQKGLIKEGPGTLRFNAEGNNTFTGVTYVMEGTILLDADGVAIPGDLQIGQGGNAPVVRLIRDNQIGDESGVIFVDHAGALDLNGRDDAIGSLTFGDGGSVVTRGGTLALSGGITSHAGSHAATIDGNLDLNGGVRTLRVARGETEFDLIIGAAISNGGLVKVGEGTLVLAGANTFDGDVDLQAGEVYLRNRQALGSSAGRTTVAGSLYLDFEGGEIAEGFVLGAGLSGGYLGSLGGSTVLTGDITLAGLGVIAVNAGRMTFAGVIDGNGGLWKVGDGELELAGDNRFLGGVEVYAGTLVVTDPHAVGTGALTISEGSSLVLDLGDAEWDFGPSLINVGGTGVDGRGAIRSLQGEVRYENSIILTADTTLGIEGDLWLYGPIHGDHNLTKTGEGNLGLMGDNVLGGEFTTVEDGTLSIGNGKALGTTKLILRSRLALGLGIDLPNDILIDSSSVAITNVIGANRLSGRIELAGVQTIGVNEFSTLTISGDVVDAEGGPAGGIVKRGPGRLRLAGENAYTGGTGIAEGTLEVASPLATGPGAILLSDGAVLSLATSDFDPTGGIVVLAGGRIVVEAPGAYRLDGAITLEGDLAFGVAPEAELTLDATMAGLHGVTKAGAGTLVLTGEQFYTGETSIEGGTLRLDGDIRSSGRLVVGAEGVLTGRGSAPAVQVLGGGTVDLGGRAETLDTGDLEFAATSALEVLVVVTEHSKNLSAVRVAGAVMLGGSALRVNAEGTPDAGDLFTLIDNDGDDAVIGQFAGLPEGATFVADGKTFRISYAGGDGNDVVITYYATSTVALTSDQSASTYGERVTFTATVSPSSGVPTGVVEFYDGDGLMGTGVLDSTYTATFRTTMLSASNHSIWAVYVGCDFVLGSHSSIVDQEVRKALLTVSADDASRMYGAANPTFTASYSGFQNGETLATSGVTGAPVLTTTATSASHVAGSPYAIRITEGSLSASNYAFHTVDGALVVTPAPLTIAANDASRPFGAANPAFTASYIGLVNGDTPADLDTPPTLATAATRTSPVEGSPYAITASGAADGDYTISYRSGSLQVTRSATAVSLASTVNPIVSGQPVTFTATVSVVAPGSGLPGGTVRFLDGSTVLGVVPVVNGMATLTDGLLSVGTHAITAEYSGGDNFVGSASPAVSLVVNRAASSTVLTVPATTVTGQSVALSLTIASVAPGSAPASGYVQFFDGGTSLGTVPVISGMAQLVVAPLSVGMHSITAVYSGDAVLVGSTSAASAARVIPAATMVNLAGPTGSVAAGALTTYTATVLPVGPGAGAPTGSVVFRLDGAIVSTQALVDGVARVTITPGATGSVQTLTAEYQGVPAYLASQALPASFQVVPAASTSTIEGHVNSARSRVNLVGTLLPATSGLRPTGKITFYVNGRAFATVNLSNGRGSRLVKRANAIGNTFSFRYAGDANFLPSRSPDLKVTKATFDAVPSGPVSAFARFLRRGHRS